jgi:hypothetical protein
MTLSKIFYLGSFGKAVAEAAAHRIAGPSATIPIEAASPTSALLANVAAFAVVVSEPDVFSLEAIALAAGTRVWLAAFPFERHIVVTPIFSIGTTCARCFVRRWLCQPPPGYGGETVLAISTLCHEHSIGGYRNLSPLAPALAATLLSTSWKSQSDSVVCLDTAALQVESNRIRPLHGCGCRCNRPRGSARFATFGPSLSAVIGDTRGSLR